MEAVLNVEYMVYAGIPAKATHHAAPMGLLGTVLKEKEELYNYHDVEKQYSGLLISDIVTDMRENPSSMHSLRDIGGLPTGRSKINLACLNFLPSS